MLNKITLNLCKNYKNAFYQKSLIVKTDFSMYKREFKNWHPRYFDVARRTEYEEKVRDFKKLRFNTQDPLHFDYKMTDITGGFKRFLEHVKLERSEKSTYSIYRIIYLIYHMAYSKTMDNEFFDELEGQITPTIANASFLNVRQIYGALFAYYKFERGKPENILFFEHAFEESPQVLHCDLSLQLFELACTSSIVDKERLELFTTNFFKPNFLMNWDKQVNKKQRLIAEFYRIFRKVNYLDEQVWNKLIETALKAPRIMNLENYDLMLKGMMWYNDTPQSPKFQKLTKEIEIFKNKIKQNENRFWRYDADNARFRTYDELVKTREDIDENYIYAFISEEVKKEDKKIVAEKKELTYIEVKNTISDKLKKGVNVLKVRRELLDQNVSYEFINDALLEFAKDAQEQTVDSLKKKGQFSPDMSSEQLREMKIKENSSAKAAAPGKADPATKKKK